MSLPLYATCLPLKSLQRQGHKLCGLLHVMASSLSMSAVGKTTALLSPAGSSSKPFQTGSLIAWPAAGVCRPSCTSSPRRSPVRAEVATGSAPSSERADIVLVDHFGRLGVSRASTSAEVASAYFAKQKELLAQKEAGDAAAEQKLQELEVSFDVLMQEPERRMYQWSLMRQEQPDGKYVWPYQADMEEIPERRGEQPRPVFPDDLEGIKKVGYFFLAWFGLSVFLNLVLPK